MTEPISLDSARKAKLPIAKPLKIDPDIAIECITEKLALLNQRLNDQITIAESMHHRIRALERKR